SVHSLKGCAGRARERIKVIARQYRATKVLYGHFIDVSERKVCRMNEVKPWQFAGPKRLRTKAWRDVDLDRRADGRHEFVRRRSAVIHGDDGEVSIRVDNTTQVQQETLGLGKERYKVARKDKIK
ncbi:MAG TPA: hypothetical protein VF389_06215, partial [Woeseiaceae bacterium]